MNNIAIKVTNLTKIYKLYDKPIDRLKESLHPLKKNYHKDFYALNEVSFEIKKGETVGIIGKKGAGKSTLLKIITGVLTPTNGNVQVNGRIASLLELGAGFNPEYTGIENIYLQGTLMGYTHGEMESKIDEILAFADIGDFVHQPVKSYSSGMFVRLAFAINIMVEPDILIVDEALSVGDALFQKRCFQHLEKIIQLGTTLLFVSHDQESIRTLTNRAIFLKDGGVLMNGNSSDVILEYRKELHEEESKYLQIQAAKRKKVIVKQVKKVDESLDKPLLRSEKLTFGDLDAQILSVRTLNSEMEEESVFYLGDEINIIIQCQALEDLVHLNVGVRIRSKEGIKVYSWGTLNQDMSILANVLTGDIFWKKTFLKDQIFEVKLSFRNTLATNMYEIQACISEEETPDYMSQRILHWVDEASFINCIVPRENFFGGAFNLNMGASWNGL